MSHPVLSRNSLLGSFARLLLAAGMLGSASAPALAQQSRAEEIAQAQEEKSTRLTPNTPSGTERALEWFEDHFTDPNTFYLTFGGIYPSGGFAPGVAGRRAFGYARMNAGAAYSLLGYKLGHAELEFPDLGGNKLEAETHARWVDATQVPFYGVGNDSIKGERANYGLRALDVGASAIFKPARWSRIGGGIALQRYEDREGAGTRPSIETRHTTSTAPGLFSESRYTHATALAAVDLRESPGYTRRGGLYSVTLNDFRDSVDRFGFRRVDAEIRQYLPVLKEQWVLAFRALVQTTRADAGQVIPYHLLPSLGGARTHRGYSDFRFQDRHLLLLSGEYRWMPSRVLDMAIFVDAGEVAPERRDLDLTGLKTAVGIGGRFHGPTMTPLRVDLARGDEGFRLHITGGVSF